MRHSPKATSQAVARCGAPRSLPMRRRGKWVQHRVRAGTASGQQRCTKGGSAPATSDERVHQGGPFPPAAHQLAAALHQTQPAGDKWHPATNCCLAAASMTCCFNSSGQGWGCSPNCTDTVNNWQVQGHSLQPDATIINSTAHRHRSPQPRPATRTQPRQTARRSASQQRRAAALTGSGRALTAV